VYLRSNFEQEHVFISYKQALGTARDAV